MAEMVLDYSEGVLLGPDAALTRSSSSIRTSSGSSFLSCARLPERMAMCQAQVGLVIGSRGCTLVARIIEGIRFLAMQQAGGFNHIVALPALPRKVCTSSEAASTSMWAFNERLAEPS